MKLSHSSLGVFIIILGILLLLRNMGIIEGSMWSILWPLLIIGAGVSLLKKNERHLHSHGNISDASDDPDEK